MRFYSSFAPKHVCKTQFAIWESFVQYDLITETPVYVSSSKKRGYQRKEGFGVHGNCFCDDPLEFWLEKFGTS